MPAVVPLPARGARALPQESADTVGAVLAHELAQPLVSTLNLLQGCRLRLDAEVLDRHALRGAIDEALRCTQQAADILGHVRQLVQRHRPKTQPTDLNALIVEVLDRLAPDRQRQDVRLHLALAADLPELPLAAVEIRQLLWNLVRNALDAMSETARDERELAISTHCEDRRWAVLTVSDRGCGIAGPRAATLFTPFHTTKPGGLGLGLAICQCVVESHGGTIRHEHPPQGGAAFRIRLPLRR